MLFQHGKTKKLVGSKFLIVQPLDKEIHSIVAIDNVGAGIGETVRSNGKRGKNWLCNDRCTRRRGNSWNSRRGTVIMELSALAEIMKKRCCGRRRRGISFRRKA